MKTKLRKLRRQKEEVFAYLTLNNFPPVSCGGCGAKATFLFSSFKGNTRELLNFINCGFYGDFAYCCLTCWNNFVIDARKVKSSNRKNNFIYTETNQLAFRVTDFNVPLVADVLYCKDSYEKCQKCGDLGRYEIDIKSITNSKELLNHHYHDGVTLCELCTKKQLKLLVHNPLAQKVIIVKNNRIA